MTLFHTNVKFSWNTISGGTKPVLDVSNNMRHVLVPADTRPGTTIYRLRASDADDNYPLIFRAEGKKHGPTPTSTCGLLLIIIISQ